MGLLNIGLETTDPGAAASGQTTLFANNSGQLAYTNSAGVTTVLGEIGSNPSASSGLNTAETVVAGGSSQINIPANSLSVGASFRITLLGTCTSTVANLSTFTIRYGTAGTTADTSVATATVTAATSGTTVAFRIVIEFTVRTIGASGTMAGSMTVMNTGTTGINTTTLAVVPFTSSGVLNTTVNSYLSVSYKTAATTTTSTFQNGIVESIR